MSDHDAEIAADVSVYHAGFMAGWQARAASDVSELDPGIRDLVQKLRQAGFRTTDSGDGRSKVEALAAGEALPFPHVACVVDDPSQLIAESHRMLAHLPDDWTVEASYDPRNGVALIVARGAGSQA